MTAPTHDLCTQPRENAVACWCRRATWNVSGLCDLHDPDITVQFSGTVPPVPGGERDPAPASPRPTPEPPPVWGHVARVLHPDVPSSRPSPAPTRGGQDDTPTAPPVFTDDFLVEHITT